MEVILFGFLGVPIDSFPDSAFVGMVSIFAMLPVPGYVVGWVRTAQRDLTKQRDARIQTVTESECDHLSGIFSP